RRARTSSRRSPSRSSTRSRTTSASTTTACTSSAGAERGRGAAAARYDRRVTTSAASDPAHVGAHDHEAVARLLHALAEPSRLAIVHLLARDERRVVDLTRELGLAQSTVSAHLTTLRD